MERQQLDVSVVICAYTEERWNDLVEAVESVKNQTVPAREIIVVIDHNQALFERAQAEIVGVVVIENGEARGLSGARNSGIATASGAIIAFLDDDATAAPDWIERLLEGYGQPEVLGVGGAIEPLWEQGRPAWFPEEFDWVVGCTYRGMPTTVAPVRNLIGANMSFRREVFERVGGFRNGMGRVDTLPIGCEETEFCIRARQHIPGSIFIYEPRATAFHKVSASRVRWRYYLSRCYFEGRSKAVVSWLVGQRDGLASERVHVLRTLPSGILRNLLEVVSQRDITGLKRTGAIIVGLAATTLGFLSGKLKTVEAARERGWAGNSRQHIIGAPE